MTDDAAHRTAADTETVEDADTVDRVAQAIQSTIDCRAPEGMAVGLIDTILLCSQILTTPPAFYGKIYNKAVQEAFQDLLASSELWTLLEIAALFHPNIDRCVGNIHTVSPGSAICYCGKTVALPLPENPSMVCEDKSVEIKQPLKL